jgi:hypothetical protein
MNMTVMKVKFNKDDELCQDFSPHIAFHYSYLIKKGNTLRS